MVVLDASALLALLLDEPGAARVQAALGDAAMSAVNLAEIVSYYAKLGAAQDAIAAMLRPLPIRIVAFDAEQAAAAGMLRPVTLHLGLSLGDRCCLALALRDQAPALTAERRWAGIAAAAGVAVEVIR